MDFAQIWNQQGFNARKCDPTDSSFYQRWFVPGGRQTASPHFETNWNNWVTWKRWGIWKVIYPSVFLTSVCQRYKSATVCCLRQAVCAKLNHCEWSGWKWPFCSKKAALQSMDKVSALKLWSFFLFLFVFFKPQQCFVHRFVNILHIFKTQDSSVSNHIFLSLFICFASLPGSWTSEKLFIRSQNYFHPQDNVKRIVFICKIYVFFLSMGNVF